MRQTIPSPAEDVEQLELMMLMGVEISTTILENYLEVPTEAGLKHNL